MANIAVQRIKREFKEVLKSEEVRYQTSAFCPVTLFKLELTCKSVRAFKKKTNLAARDQSVRSALCAQVPGGV